MREKILIRDVQIEDVPWMAARLRKLDRQELIASTGQDPVVALAASAKMGNCWVAEYEGEPVAILGLPVVSQLPVTGIPWMLGTDWLDENGLTFGRVSVDIVGGWMDSVDYMVNHVDSRNRKAVEWLEWLGFDIEEAVPFGPYGVPFHKFTWRRGRSYV